MSRPHQSAIPLGSALLAVRHQPVTKKQDLQHLHISTDKRIWLRLKDPGSSRATIREDSSRVPKLFQSWVSTLVPTRSLCPKPFWSGYAAADACASGDTTQIGGFIQSTSGRKLWFAEKFTHSDFHFLPFSTDPAMQKSISAFETLAQIGLVWLAASFFPGFRIPICLKSLSDNTGAESVSNKMFTTTKAVCFFVEILATLATKTGIELDVSHIPGESNLIADDLSRWSFDSEIPHGFQPESRIRSNLRDLWAPCLKCTKYPSDAHLL